MELKDMQGPTQDWTRARLYNVKKSEITLLEGTKLVDASDEAAVFEILEIGPDVHSLTIGTLVIASFMSGMMKFKLPNDKDSSFAIKETDVIYVITEGGEVCKSSICSK